MILGTFPNIIHRLSSFDSSKNNSSCTTDHLRISDILDDPVDHSNAHRFTLDEINTAPDYGEYVPTLAEHKYQSLTLVLDCLQSTSDYELREVRSKKKTLAYSATTVD